MSKKFLAILKKNFKLLVRSKSSAVIILLGPLIVVLLVGLAFSNTNNQFALSVGVYSEKYSDLTDSLVQKLAHKFTVYKFESVVDCVKYVRRNKINICVDFPPDLDVKKEGGTNEITFYLDFSRVNMVWIVLDTLTEKVSERSAEISTDLTQILLTKLSEVNNESESNSQILKVMVSRQGEMSAQINDMYSDLSSVDLSMNAEEFKESEIASSAKTVYDLSQDITSECQDALLDLQDMLGDMNCSSISAADSRINRAYKNISDKSEELNSEYGVEGNDTVENSLLYYLELMSETVGKAETQLGSVSQVKEKITADSSLRKDMKEHSEDLEELKDSMGEMQNKISSIEIQDASTIVNPITTKIQPVTVENTYFSFLFPTLIVLIVMITSILLASTIVMNEKKSPSFFRNNIAPVGQFLFNLGTYLTSFIIILVQLIIFVTVALIFVNLSLLGAVPTTLMSLFFIISVFVLIGMCIGFFFKSEETTTLAAISISALLLFFSNTVLPIESMPFYIRMIAQYNPFVISEGLLKQSLVFHAPITAFAHGILYLVIGCAAFFIVLLALVIRSRKETFYKHKTKYNR
ncbi:ABC transporter permease [Candidatus Woesearchaeota archaeon]|nr:ABC transporter permease [Candidatus Woesearchaeota archaeon]